MNVGAERGKLICGMGECEPGLPRMKPGEDPPGKSGLLRQCKDGFLTVSDAARINPTATLVLASFVQLMRLGERREHKRLWSEADFEFRETFGDNLAPGVGEDRLGKDIVEGDAESGGGEVGMIKEGWTLQFQHRPSDLRVDAGINQPAIGLEAVIAPRKEIRDEQPASPERSAAKIE